MTEVKTSWKYTLSFTERLLCRSPQTENGQTAPYKSDDLVSYIPLCLLPFDYPPAQVF